nr:hypothetical protein [Tanacetum cinerariifolium]
MGSDAIINDLLLKLIDHLGSLEVNGSNGGAFGVTGNGGSNDMGTSKPLVAYHTSPSPFMYPAAQQMFIPIYIQQPDKEEFQEMGSMAAFKVLTTQLQMLIKSWIYLDDEYVIMTRKYFLKCTQLEIREFRDTMIQHMESVKKSIDKRVLHKREYDSRVNERQMQTTEEKVDTSKALDASLVNVESSGTEYGKQDTSSSSRNDADVDDADIKPVYDEEPMAELQLTSKNNVFATGQQHTQQPKFNNE